MNDSTNVRVMADNIRKLEKMVKEAGSELPTPSAGDVGKVLTVNSDLGYSVDSVPREVPTPGAGDTGKILKVGSDGYELATEYSYTPPAYSTTETDTGKKWIDGKTVYCITYSGTTPTENTSLLIEFSFDTLINVTGCFTNEYGLAYDFNKYLSWNGTNTKVGIFVNYSSSYPGRSFHLVIYYTKPTPVPAETSTKKTTKKG